MTKQAYIHDTYDSGSNNFSFNLNVGDDVNQFCEDALNKYVDAVINTCDNLTTLYYTTCGGYKMSFSVTCYDEQHIDTLIDYLCDIECIMPRRVLVLFEMWEVIRSDCQDIFLSGVKFVAPDSADCVIQNLGFILPKKFNLDLHYIEEEVAL